MHDNPVQGLESVVAWLRRAAMQRLPAIHSGGLRLDPGLIAELGRRGVLGAPFEGSLGGLGLDCRQTLTLVEQIAAIDLSLAAFVDDPAWGWTAWSSGEVRAHLLDGDHASLLRPPRAAEVALRIDAHLTLAHESPP